MDDKAYLRRKFPNLKTKSAFPLFLPYLLTKIIYIGNVIGHYFLLGHIFNINYFEFGIYSLINIWNNKFDFLNQYFPKRSLCDVQFFTKWVLNRYTVMCSLPLNLFNEIFYFGLWYWLLFIGCLTIMSLFYWMLMFVKPYRRSIVLKALQISEVDIKSSYIAAYYLENNETTFDTADSFLLAKTGLTLMDNFELFFNDVCSVDVCFAIRMIAVNSNQLAMRDIFNNLWDQYLDLEELKMNEVKYRPHVVIKRPPINLDNEESRKNDPRARI